MKKQKQIQVRSHPQLQSQSGSQLTQGSLLSDTWVLVTPSTCHVKNRPQARTLTPWTNQVGDSHFTSPLLKDGSAKNSLKKRLQGPSTQGRRMHGHFPWPLGPGATRQGWEDHRAREVSAGTRLPASEGSLPNTCGRYL